MPKLSLSLCALRTIDENRFAYITAYVLLLNSDFKQLQRCANCNCHTIRPPLLSETAHFENPIPSFLSFSSAQPGLCTNNHQHPTLPSMSYGTPSRKTSQGSALSSSSSAVSLNTLPDSASPAEVATASGGSAASAFDANIGGRDDGESSAFAQHMNPHAATASPHEVAFHAQSDHSPSDNTPGNVVYHFANPVQTQPEGFENNASKHRRVPSVTNEHSHPNRSRSYSLRTQLFNKAFNKPPPNPEIVETIEPQANYPAPQETEPQPFGPNNTSMLGTINPFRCLIFCLFCF